MALKVERVCVLPLKLREWVFQERRRVHNFRHYWEVNENGKTPSNSFNIEISDGISKNYFGEILVTESNIEWAEQCMINKVILLGSLAMKAIR